VSALQQDSSITLECSTLVGLQFLPKTLAVLLQGFVGHAHDVELIDHDAGLWKSRLNSAAVGLPHIHTDDLHIVAVGHVHKALDHGILLTTGQKVQQGSLL